MDNFLIAKATDVGVARQFNEDSMTVFDSPNGQVLAVCDGMGGQAAGDVASQLAVNIIENILTDNIFGSPEEAISRSILAANQGVLNRTAQNPELEGMGSTCVMLIIKNGRVHCGWVGDSRIYYIANHTIRQISHDQSYVQQLVDSGQISKAEATNHPQKNEITNCIGLQGMSAPETIAVPIVPEPGSVFLLCSDGLSSMMDEKQIEHVISNPKMSLQQKADRLVTMANEAGGLDNITVELVQFGTSEVAGATSGTLFETPANVNENIRKSRKMLYSFIGIFIALTLGLSGGYAYMQKQKEKERAKIENSNKKKTGGQKAATGSSSNNTDNPIPPTPSPQNPNVKPNPQDVLNSPGNNGNSIERTIQNKSKKGGTKVIENLPKVETDEERKAREEKERIAREEEERKQNELKELMKEKD